MRLSKAASFLLSQSQSLSQSPLIRSSNATAATAAAATRPLTLTALPKRTRKTPFEEEILLQDDNNNESHLSNKKNFFYPVSPGDVFAEGKYSMISKLGWGRNSTVWLAEERGRERGRWRYVLFFLFFFVFFFIIFLGYLCYGNCQSGTRAIRNNRILTAVFFPPLESSGSKSNNNHLLPSSSTIAMSTRMRFAMN